MRLCSRNGKISKNMALSFEKVLVGRPRAGRKRKVVDDLLKAAEYCLSLKSQDELTRAEIATAAGANSAMIGYYFESKEGLLGALLDGMMKDLVRRLRTLEAELDVCVEDPTRRIVVGLADAYGVHSGACRVLSVELRKKNSEIKDEYKRRYAAVTVDQLSKILAKLVDRGIYDANLNLKYAAFTLRTLVTYPLAGIPVWEAIGNSGDAQSDTQSKEEWVDYIVAMLDRQFRSALVG